MRRGILYARDWWDLPRKRSCQIKSSSEKAIWEGAGQGQLLHFSKYDGYTRAFDREVAIDSRG